MRGRSRPLFAALLGLAALAAAGDSRASQAAPTAQASPQGTPPPAGAPAPGATPAPPAAQEIDDFVPTERLSADDAVSFPTDI
jgi:hypothetical protein